MSEYTKQADNFLKKTGTKMIATEIGYDKYFPDDKESRYIFRVKLTRKNRGSYSFKFGQSIHDGSTPPSNYDVLTCLTKYDVGTFEDFCGEFGYDTDSRKAEKLYKNVVKEYNNVKRLFSDVMEELQEIQ